MKEVTQMKVEVSMKAHVLNEKEFVNAFKVKPYAKHIRNHPSVLVPYLEREWFGEGLAVQV